MRLSVTVLALLVLPLLAHTQQNLDEKIRVERDIVFGKGGDKDLKLDLYAPKNGTGPFPAVVCVHGGSWRSGSYKVVYVAQTAKELASRGYVAISVQYRLSQEAKFPAQIADCKCAVRWLRANAEKYRVDPKHIGAVGFSAGGHLVCLLGVTTKEDGLDGDGGNTNQPSDVQAVVDFFGPADLRKGDVPGRTTLKDLVGASLQDQPEAYAKASPITYIRNGRAVPPFLLIHGTADKLVSIDQSVRLHDALKSAGGEATLIRLEGEGHGTFKPETMRLVVSEMVTFFDKHLKKKG